jgi:hypothetical protein
LSCDLQERVDEFFECGCEEENDTDQEDDDAVEMVANGDDSYYARNSDRETSEEL